MPAELPVGLESSIDQETPLDLLLNAITEPIDTNADVLAGTEGVYAEGAFGLANEKHGDCQESHAVDTGGGDGSTHQEPVEDAQVSAPHCAFVRHRRRSPLLGSIGLLTSRQSDPLRLRAG